MAATATRCVVRAYRIIAVKAIVVVVVVTTGGLGSKQLCQHGSIGGPRYLRLAHNTDPASGCSLQGAIVRFVSRAPIPLQKTRNQLCVTREFV